jgi:hypothetical protein
MRVLTVDWLVSGADEASTRDDELKGPCQLWSMRNLTSLKSILSDDTFRLSKLIAGIR